MIELQQDGHLHWHIMLYSGVLLPELLEEAATASSMALQSQIGKMLDSITCTTVPCDIHQWYNDILSSVEHGSKHPRGADIKVLNASSNYKDFISIGMKKIRTNGYAWSWILLQKREKGEIHMLLSVQTRSSYTDHLSPSEYYSDQRTLQKNNMQMYELTLWMNIPLPC